MTAVYEQAQRIQGADGPIAHPVDPSPSALDALGTVLALWTPYGGLTDPHSPGSAPGLDVFKSPPGQAPPS
jgi:hypothetical protein